MTKKTDVMALGRCDGMGEMSRVGSYVKLAYHDGGETYHLVISEGCAANLVGELGGALAQREDATLEAIMRDVRGV